MGLVPFGSASMTGWKAAFSGNRMGASPIPTEELRQKAAGTMSDHISQETTFAVTTLGCKVNQAESEAIGEQMSAAGFMQRDFDEVAAIYIINTCTVTHLDGLALGLIDLAAERR